MIVLFLSFVSSMILVKSELILKHDAKFKDQLQKSLTHVNEMLADIEDKIEDERRKLSQIDDDLNYKDTPTGYLDYKMTDIWWSSQTPCTPPQLSPTETHLESTTQSEPPSSPPSSPQGALRYQQNLTTGYTNTTYSPRIEEPAITDIVANWVRIMASSQVSTDLTETSPTSSTTSASSTSSTPSTPTTIPPTDPTFTDAPVTSVQTPTTTATTKAETQSPGVPPGWPFEDIPTTPLPAFVHDLQEEMVKSTYGFFTVAATKFFELMKTKELKQMANILDGMEVTFGKFLDQHKLDAFGPTLQGNMVIFLGMINALPPSLLQKQANVIYFILQNKNKIAAPEVSTCFDLYDSMFQETEGLALFNSLEPIARFPAEGLKATEVSESMLNAALQPFWRTKGTREHKKLLFSINEAIKAHNPDWRTGKSEEMYNDTSSIITNSGAIYLSPMNEMRNFTDPRFSLLTRRGMGFDFKKLIHHFLTKHRKLFKRLNEHHKNKKRNKHRHFHHKVRHHSSHRKHKKHQNENRDAHDKHNSHNKHNKHDPHDKHSKYDIRTKHDSYTQHESNKKQDAFKKPDLFNDHGSYINQYKQFEQRKRYEQFMKSFRKTDQLNLGEINLEDKEDTSGSDAFFQGKKLKPKPIYKSRNISRGHIKTEPIDKQYLIELAKKFKASIKNQNYRRLIMSSENETKEKSESSTKNKTVHKIREASSYSDEEDHLRMNLYDALRHGNRTFKDIHNDTIHGLSGDEELIIQNNLYKSFK